LLKLYLPLKGSQALYPPQNESYLILEWQTRGIDLYGILRPPQRRVISAQIGLIALFNPPGLFLDLSRGRLPSGILEQPPACTFLEPCNQKDFHICVGKDDGAHISAVGHQISMDAQAALHTEQPVTDRRQAGDGRNVPGHLNTPELRREKHTITVDVHTVALRFDLNIEPSQLVGSETPPLLRRYAVL